MSILAAAALSACGTETIDAGDLEQELAEQLSPQARVDPADVSVECPEDQEVAEGSEFQCTLVAPNGDDVQVDVTLTDDQGGFEAEVPPQQFK
ncbi:MAG: DUF4333 domain-containing protein [Solirubrobacterales bacterium]